MKTRYHLTRDWKPTRLGADAAGSPTGIRALMGFVGVGDVVPQAIVLKEGET